MNSFESLTRFIPLLQDGDIGGWVFDEENDGSPEQPMRAPYVRYSEKVSSFIDALLQIVRTLIKEGSYDYYSVLQDSGLSYQEPVLAKADVSNLDGRTIIAMMNAVLAGERFSDGAMGRFIANGCIVRWLERLKEIDNGLGI